ncbi:hypothetical protein V6X10_21230, partial [Enterobacter asburiae]|uniref:hypothetical protein n=1 Tax=Enterobacter asburiae TaxID=61645 RepID=UPI002FE5ADFA
SGWPFFVGGAAKVYIWYRLHRTGRVSLSEYSLCMIAFLLLLHRLSVKSEMCSFAMHITSFTSIFSKL